MADPVAPTAAAQVPPVQDDEVLRRLLFPQAFVPVEKGGPRVSSMAFKDRRGPRCEVSVFRRGMMTSELRKEHLKKFQRAAEIVAAKPRELQHQVEPDTAEGQHESHAVIIPRDQSGGVWRRDADALAKASTVVDLMTET